MPFGRQKRRREREKGWAFSAWLRDRMQLRPSSLRPSARRSVIPSPFAYSLFPLPFSIFDSFPQFDLMKGQRGGGDFIQETRLSVAPGKGRDYCAVGVCWSVGREGGGDVAPAARPPDDDGGKQPRTATWRGRQGAAASPHRSER